MTDVEQGKTETVEVAQVKGALRSSINIAGILLILCSAVSDPLFKEVFGDLIPAEWLSRITGLAGMVIMYFRSNGSNNIALTWGKPIEGVKDALVEVTRQPGKETVTTVIPDVSAVKG